MLQRTSEVLSGSKIIVATAREMMGANLRHALKREGGAAEVAIKSGPETLGLISQGFSPDVVICDFHLEVISGPEMVEFLNREAQWSTIPKVMFLPQGDQSAIQQTLQCGIKGIILTPFTVNTAIKVVQRALGR